MCSTWILAGFTSPQRLLIADLSNGESSILLVTEEALRTIESNLPSGTGIVGRVRPLFKDGDFLLIGRTDAPAPRQAAATESLTR